MKNRTFAVSLLATTALLSSPVLAAEKIKVEVGGFMEQWFGYVDQDRVSVGGGVAGQADNGGFDQKSDTEIHFMGSMVADNGLTFGFEVQLEGNTDGDQIDDSFAYVEGGFGRAEIGARDGAAVLMQYVAPNVGIGLNSGDQSSWVANLTAGSTSSAFYTTFLYLGDDQSQKLTYFSPRISGFQIGASYTPEFRQDDSGLVPGTGGVYRNGYQVGINFVETFGGFDVALAAGYAAASNPNSAAGFEDAKGYSFGANIGFGGFTVGASYANTDGNDGVGGNAATSIDGHGYDVGISYTTGPASISLTYYYGEVEGAIATPGEDTQKSLMLSGSYDLGPGVSAVASIFGSKFEGDAAGSADDNEGIAGVGGIVLSF